MDVTRVFSEAVGCCEGHPLVTVLHAYQLSMVCAWGQWPCAWTYRISRVVGEMPHNCLHFPRSGVKEWSWILCHRWAVEDFSFFSTCLVVSAGKHTCFMWKWTWFKVGRSSVLAATEMIKFIIMNLSIFIHDFLWKISVYPQSSVAMGQSLHVLLWWIFHCKLFDKLYIYFGGFWWRLWKVLVPKSSILAYTFIFLWLSANIQYLAG